MQRARHLRENGLFSDIVRLRFHCVDSILTSSEYYAFKVHTCEYILDNGLKSLASSDSDTCCNILKVVSGIARNECWFGEVNLNLVCQHILTSSELLCYKF